MANMPQIPLEALQYSLGGCHFWFETDGELRMMYHEDEGPVWITLPADIAFLLMTAMRMPGVRSLLVREELARQRQRHQAHVKTIAANEQRLSHEKYDQNGRGKE
jgi:hypothetical protein